MSFLRTIWVLLFSVALSFAAAFLLSYLPKSPVQGPMLLGLSFICEYPESGLTLSYVDANGDYQDSHFESINPSFNHVQFRLPYQQALDSLNITVRAGHPVHITGLSISAGDYFKVFRPDDIVQWFDIHEDHVIDEMAQLSIVPGQDGALELTLNRPIVFVATELETAPWKTFVGHFDDLVCFIDIEQGDYAWSLFLPIFIIILLVQFILFWLVNEQVFFKAQIVAFILAVISGATMVMLKENVKKEPVMIGLKSSGRKGWNQLYAYYSKNGVLDQDSVVFGNRSLKDSVVLQLPIGPYRHFRIDLPLRDTITITSLSIGLPDMKSVYTGYDIVDALPMLNDLNYRVTEAGDLIIQTGTNDPYLSVGSSMLLDAYLVIPKLLERYYYYISTFLFIAFLLIFLRFGFNGRVLFITMFFCLLILPDLVFVFKEDVQTLNAEKRKAKQWPLEWESYRELTFGIGEYLNDQFGGRSWLITKWYMVNYFLFGEVDNSASVVFGKDNWMFYQALGVSDLIKNKDPLTLEEMRRMVTVLEQRRVWLKTYGIDYYVVFPPLKFAVYEEMLPKRFKKWNPLSRRDQFERYLIDSTELNHIALKEALFTAKSEEGDPIYFKYDSHWNMTGAYYAYREIISQIAKDHPEVGPPMRKDTFKWEMVKSNQGDLAKMISLNDVLIREEFMPDLKQNKASKVGSKSYMSLFGIKTSVTFQQPDTSLPSLLVDHDSFSNYLKPYLSEHFYKTIFVKTSLFSGDVIKEELPDVVITEMTARSFDFLMLDNFEPVISELEAFDGLESQTEVLGTQR